MRSLAEAEKLNLENMIVNEFKIIKEKILTNIFKGDKIKSQKELDKAKEAQDGTGSKTDHRIL